MEIVEAALLAVFFYAVLVGVFRLLGKRELNQLSSLDVVMNIFIANMAASGIVDESRWLEALAGVLLIVCLQLLMNYAQLRYAKLRELTDEEPSMLVLNGRINYEELKRLKIDLDEVVMMLRINGVLKIEEVSYAMMERNGHLSIFLKSNPPEYFPLPIIISGHIKRNVLRYYNVSESAFLAILNHHQLNDLSLLKVVYLHYQHLYVYTKDEYFIVTLNPDEYIIQPM